jgi:outer membrane protein assembly factor BamB
MRRCLLGNLLVALTVLGGASADGPRAAEPPSWPRFHGPQGDNISPDTGLLKQWPKEGPKLLWTARDIGEGFSSVALAGGRIYTNGNKDDKTIVTALDLDGKILWQRPNGEAWTGGHPGARSTPTIEEDRLYDESPLGDVACLAAKDGKPVWHVNILEKFAAENIKWALAESLWIDGQHVICCPGGPQTAVVALDKNSGAVAWKSPSAGDAAAYASPVVIEHGGLRIVLTMTAKALIGVDADSGALLFRHPHETAYDVNALMPIFHAGCIFISSGYGAGSELLKLKVEGKKAAVERVWQNKDLDNHHGGVVLLDDYLYGSAFKGGDHAWVCLDWKDGKTMYRAAGVGKGSLTCAEGMLYTYSENGKVGLVRATPAGHEVISQFYLPKGGEGPCWAHPVVCGGRLYLRHGNFLYAYDVKAP